MVVPKVVDLFNGKLDLFDKDFGIEAILMARKAMTSSKQKMEKTPPPIANVRDVHIPLSGRTLSARLYTPLAAGHPPGPGLVFFHGGGWLVGDVAGYDNVCRRLAATARIRVLSVEYRLGPEHKFPAAHDDARESFLWVLANAEKLDMDRAQISIGGDSAGGNMTAGISAMATREGIGVKSQFLLFPLLQMVEMTSKQRKSPEAHILGKPALETIEKYYVNGADLANPLISPLLDELPRGMPPTYMVTCGFDPLQHEGKVYADRLAHMGVRVQHTHFKLMPHGFLNLTGLVPGAEDASLESFETFGKFVGTRPLR